MPEFLKILKPEDVEDDTSYAAYVQQKIGAPCAGREIAALRRTTKKFFAEHPQADWGTLCQLVDWARAKKKRPPTAARLVSWFPYAWSDGYISLPDPGAQVDENLERALTQEPDPSWRRKIALAVGQSNREEVYDSWLERQRSLTSL